MSTEPEPRETPKGHRWMTDSLLCGLVAGLRTAPTYWRWLWLWLALAALRSPLLRLRALLAAKSPPSITLSRRTDKSASALHVTLGQFSPPTFVRSDPLSRWQTRIDALYRPTKQYIMSPVVVNSQDCASAGCRVERRTAEGLSHMTLAFWLGTEKSSANLAIG